MKNRLLGTSVLVGIGSFAQATAGARAQEGSPAVENENAPEDELQDAGSLERVAPVPSTGHPRAHVFSREFERSEWRALLGARDLGERERNYADLVRRARIDPVARAFVEDLARDTSAPELAWTARLALRELGPARSPLSGMLPGDPLRMNERMEGLLREFWSDPDGLTFFLHPPQVGKVPELQGRSGGSRSVRIHQTPEGARIVVSEDVGGEKKEHVYEGASVGEILGETPELAQELDQLGIGLGDTSGILDLRFDLAGGPSQDLLRPFDYGEGGEELFERLFAERGNVERLFAPRRESSPVRTDVLGVKPVPLTPEHAAELALEPGLGLYVVSTYPGTIAHLLGVRSGHVLLELDGRPLRSDADITATMRARGPGDALTLLWIDELGQRQTKTWTPNEPQATPKKLR